MTGLGEDGIHQVALGHDRGVRLRLQPIPLLVQGGDQTLVLARVGVVLLMRPGEGLGGRRVARRTLCESWLTVLMPTPSSGA